MLVGKQSETVQQLLAGDENHIGLHEGTEEVAGLEEDPRTLFEGRRKRSAGVKSLGIGNVGDRGVRIQGGERTRASPRCRR